MSSLFEKIIGRAAANDRILQVLGRAEDVIPRFRGAYIDTSTGTARLAVYTRSGTAAYDNAATALAESGLPAWNGPLRSHARYISDEQDTFDPSYRLFFFSIPPAAQAEVDSRVAAGEGQAQKPAALFAAIKAAIQSGSISAGLRARLDAMSEDDRGNLRVQLGLSRS